MKMFRMGLHDLDGMPVETLLDRLTEIWELDPKARLTIEDMESWDSLSNEVTPYYEIVCYHKDERGQ